MKDRGGGKCNVNGCGRFEVPAVKINYKKSVT